MKKIIFAVAFAIIADVSSVDLGRRCAIEDAAISAAFDYVEECSATRRDNPHEFDRPCKDPLKPENPYAKEEAEIWEEELKRVFCDMMPPPEPFKRGNAVGREHGYESRRRKVDYSRVMGTPDSSGIPDGSGVNPYVPDRDGVILRRLEEEDVDIEELREEWERGYQEGFKNMKAQAVMDGCDYLGE